VTCCFNSFFAGLDIGALAAFLAASAFLAWASKASFDCPDFALTGGVDAEGLGAG